MKKQVEVVFFSDCEQHLLSYNHFENFKLDCENLENRILRAFETLTQREVEVLSRRFGLFDCEPETLKEIGFTVQNAINGNIGIDVETVRVIEAKALRKLRHPTRRHFFE